MSDKARKILKWSLVSIAVLVVVALAAGGLYWNRMLNLLGDAAEQTVPTLSYEEEMALLGTTEAYPFTVDANSCSVLVFILAFARAVLFSESTSYLSAK